MRGGKMTLAFPDGFQGVEPQEVLAAVEQVAEDLVPIVSYLEQNKKN